MEQQVIKYYKNSEAIDVENANYSYNETDEKIEEEYQEYLKAKEAIEELEI
jgi:hypothetical protein